VRRAFNFIRMLVYSSGIRRQDISLTVLYPCLLQVVSGNDSQANVIYKQVAHICKLRTPDYFLRVPLPLTPHILPNRGPISSHYITRHTDFAVSYKSTNSDTLAIEYSRGG